MTELDVDHLRSWIGKQETLHDQVTRFPIAALSATLDRDDPAPRGRRSAAAAVALAVFPADRAAVRSGSGRSSGARRFPAAGAVAAPHVGGRPFHVP